MTAAQFAQHWTCPQLRVTAMRVSEVSDVSVGMTTRQVGDPPGSRNEPQESIDASVGRRVKNRREELGLDLSAVAAEMCFSIDDILEIESGRRRAGAAALSAFSSALKVPITYFFTDYEPDGLEGAARSKGANRGAT